MGNPMIRLAGYNAGMLEQESRATRHVISLMGTLVLLAALAAGISWGIAGYSLAGGDASRVALAGGLAGGVLGFLMVAVLDSAAIHMLDTQEQHWTRGVLLAAIRVTIPILVSSVTVNATASTLLAPELKGHALTMREQFGSQRLADLEGLFKVDSKEKAAAAAASRVDAARKAADTIPASILAREAAAKSCWRTYASAKRTLVEDGYEDHEVLRRLSGTRTRCAGEERRARAERQAYEVEARAALKEAEAMHSASVGALDNANQAINMRMTEAENIEREAITPASATVLESLLQTDRGARWKWYGFWFFLVAVELLPLVIKLLASRTPAGVGIATNHAIEIAGHRRRRGAAEEDLERESALRAAMDDAMETALRSPSVQAQMARSFEATMSAFVPFEAYRQLVAEIERGSRVAQEATRKYPDYAHALGEAWARTINDVIDRLQNKDKPGFAASADALH